MPTFDTTTRAELDVVADEHRDEWIAHQEALAAAEGFGAEQPEGCDSIDPFAGLAFEPLTPAELDQAVRHDEQRAYGVGR
jgi:hypothetical protein